MAKENVNFRLNQDEYQALQHEADERGLSLSEYLRRIIKNREAARDVTHDELVERLQAVEDQLGDN